MIENTEKQMKPNIALPLRVNEQYAAQNPKTMLYAGCQVAPEC